MKYDFATILVDQLDSLMRTSEKEVLRDLAIKNYPHKATTITGIRRCGKSTLLKQHIRLKKNNPPLYLSFFDERLAGIQARDLNEAIVSYGTLYDGQGPIIFLFDEIQVVHGWEDFIARLLENPINQVYITGSSSRMLSREISTSLRGRNLRYELFPFSWKETLRLNGLDIKNLSSTKKGLLRKKFDLYLKWGSFPEVLLADPLEKQLILKEYFEVLLFRDLVERNQFAQVAIARQIFVTLVRMYGNKFSLNQTHKKLRSEGIKIDKTLLASFLRWCEDAYILYPIKLWTQSEHKARVNPLKLYLADFGLAQACETWDIRNVGRRFENACFLNLRSKPKFASLHYYITQNGREVDFLYEEIGGERALIQVCWEINDMNRERELVALEEAMGEIGIRQSYVITLDQLEDVKVPTGKIHIVSFHSFFGR